MCSDRSIEMKLPALLGNYDRPTDDRWSHWVIVKLLYNRVFDKGEWKKTK